MTGTTGPISSLEDARAKGFNFPLFEKPLSAWTLVEELEALRHEQPGFLFGHLEQVGIA